MGRVGILLFAVGTLGVTGCAAEVAYEGEELGEEQAPIVGGYEGLSPDVYKQVLLTYHRPAGDDTRCTATLLSNDVAITARHCVTVMRNSVSGAIEPDPTRIQLDMGSQSTHGIEIVDLRAFPDADPNTDSVLVVAERFFKTGTRRGGHRQKITEWPEIYWEDKDVLCLGYGVNVGGSDPPAETAGTLRFAWLPVLHGSDAAFLIGENASGQHIFRGDSGGTCFLNHSEGLVMLGINHEMQPGTNNAIQSGPQTFRSAAIREYSNGYVHTANSSNTSSHMTTLDDPELNGKPNAHLFATPNFVTGGVHNNHAIGVWYDGLRWRIYNQDLAAMPVGVSFHYSVGGGFVHQTVSTNTSFAATRLDHPELNGNPNAAFVFTTNFSAGAHYHRAATNVRFNSAVGRWEIFNPDGTPMPTGIAFNVRIERSKVMNGLVLGSGAFLDDPNLNGNPDVKLFVTARVQTGTPSVPHPISVNYSSGFGRWLVMNEDGAAMPSNVRFNVLVRP
ncbi:MAG: hypothetical protein AB7K71_02720 [Polyangiaceae bacterium]